MASNSSFTPEYWRPTPHSEHTGLRLAALGAVASDPLSPSRLERLAADHDLRYIAQFVPEEDQAQPEEDSTFISSTNVPSDARGLLRARGFHLHCAGTSRLTASSSTLPCVALDREPALSLSEAASAAPLQRRARQVELLLSARHRAQHWSPERARQLIEMVDPKLHSLEALEHAFGPGLAFDVAWTSAARLGSSPAVIGAPEETFNFGLNVTVMRAVNAILLLTELCDDDSHPDQDQGAISTDPGGTAGQSRDDNEEDQQAAARLVRACHRLASAKAMRFITATASTNFDAKHRDALRFVKPDWLLVSGPVGSYEVLGVVESKPKTAREGVRRLALHRLDPLGTDHKLERDVIQAQLEASAPASSSVRGNTRPNYAESPAPSRRQEVQAQQLGDPRAQPEYGYATGKGFQKLLLQLSSQMILLNARHALLWAASGEVLLPATMATAPLSRGLDGGCPLFACSLAFAPLLLDTALSTPPEPAPTAPAASTSVVGQEQQLGHHRLPNIIMAFVQWAWSVKDDLAKRGRLLPDDVMALPLEAPKAADGATGGQGSTSDQSGGAGSSRKQGKRRAGGAASTSREVKKQRRRGQSEPARDEAADADSVPASSSLESLADGDHGRRGPLRGDGASSSGPSSPERPSPAKSSGEHVAPERRTVEIFSFANGRFARAHRGVISRQGELDVPCVYKINRSRARMAEEIERWNEVDDEGGEGPLERFHTELEALEDLEGLQGSVVPRLYGTSTVPAVVQPGDAPALILEHVGEPVYMGHWPAELSVEERQRLIRDAFDALHRAGWLHGDVAARNVLLSVKPAAEDSSREEARICLIDFGRARRRPSSPELDASLLRSERANVEELLVDLFFPERSLHLS